MTKFETFLIKKGYQKYVFNCKEMKYEKTNQHVISTMVNLDHRYIHIDDFVLLDKIDKGLSVRDKNFTSEDQKNVIIFGLNEFGLPPTLISPRPRIKILKDNITLTEQNESAMHIVLGEVNYEDIFKAMFDKSICFEFDLTTKN